MLDKFGISAAMQEIAGLLELKGGNNRFKAKAYRSGARAIAGLSGDVSEFVADDKLTSIRGIGDALASQIKQLHLTGTSSVLEALRKEFPPGVLELATVPGLTVPKIKKLYDALNITSIAALRKAAEEGDVRKVSGFGEKTELALLESIKNETRRASAGRRLHVHHAERIAKPIIDYLETARGFEKATISGSLRRRKETIGVIRIVAAAKSPSSLIKYFLRFPLIVRTESQTNNTCTVELLEGAKISLTAVEAEKYPVALLITTGSKAHVQRLEEVAEKRRLHLDLNDFHLSPLKHPPKNEKEIYGHLKMQFIPPELREDEGEIEAALAEKIPTDLITVEDIKGMVHCHTTYSDGVNSIEQMARAAEEMGMKYLTITDHSPTAFYAGGVTVDRLMRQWDEIDEVQQRVKVKLLKGTESDILANGSLDYPDEVLEKFDVIVASVHSRYKMDSVKMTRRVLTAMRQPVFKIWGHALGRLLERRPAFDCDVPKILDAIAESKAAIEINGDPYRLDLEPRWVREARKRKIKFVISVDAHSTGALNNVRFGVGVARRGWVRRGEVLNTLAVNSFIKAVRPS